MILMEFDICAKLTWFSALYFLGMFYINGQAVRSANCCSRDDGGGIGFDQRRSEKTKLFQYDPVEIGHIRRVELDPGRTVSMKTLAIRPPIFEVKNFLTTEECDYIKSLAMANGLEVSKTAVQGSTPNISELRRGFNESFWRRRVTAYDVDGDAVLDPQEAIECLAELRMTNVTAAMLDLMMTDLELDQDSDARLEPRELWRISEHGPSEVAEDIRAWLTSWRNGDGERLVKRWKGRTRVSQQTWLSSREDDRLPLRDIQERIVALTRLPPEIVYTSEEMQVVRYHPGGHYHAHHDSDDIDQDLECRHTAISLNKSRGRPFSETRCRFCRYVTVLYYLNDVDDGGETAFPFADMSMESPQYEAKMSYDYTDLSDHCYDSNLIVKPERGKAILWYNHDMDRATGWLGARRERSLHGGCEVRRGTKWIANNWLSVDDKRDRQAQYVNSLKNYMWRTTTSPSTSKSSTHDRQVATEQAQKKAPFDEDDTFTQLNCGETSTSTQRFPGEDYQMQANLRQP